MTLALREPQVPVVAAVSKLIRPGPSQVRRVLLQAPTGFGKTVLATHMVGTAASRGFTCWFVNHRRELIAQSSRAFELGSIDHGIICNGWLIDRAQRVQICGVQSLGKRMHRYPAPGLILWDECHHLGAKSWGAIMKAFPDAIHIGLSATPERLDGIGLGEFFDEIVCGPSIGELMRDGWLTTCRVKYPKVQLDTSGVNLHDKRAVARLLEKSTITGDSVRDYVNSEANGRRAIAFYHSVQDSMEAVAAFRAAGIPAEHVDGESSDDHRDGAIARFVRGETLVLSNVDLFGEGFDVPGAEVLIDCAPTWSLGRKMQRDGRVMRPVFADGFDLSTAAGRLASIAAGPKPYAIIHDHAGNSGKLVDGAFVPKHGLPDDERAWGLEGRKASKVEKGPATRRCPKCLGETEAWRTTCNLFLPTGEACKHDFESCPREVAQVDGELHDHDPTRHRLNAHTLAAARGWMKEDLEAEALRRGIKNPRAWAHHAYQQREQAKRRGIV